MNVAEDFASENWEKLFKYIIRLGSMSRHAHRRYEDIYVELDDGEADRYDFSNAILMRRMRERLVEALQGEGRPRRIGYLAFGNKFFMTMNEQQQQSFFSSIFNLPVLNITVGEETEEWTENPAITISTPALLESLPQLHTGVDSLQVSNFALTRQSDVQALSIIILSKCSVGGELLLKSIECSVDDFNKENSDESDGFLDPLLYAASVSFKISISTKTRSVHSSLVSPRALRALIGRRRYRLLILNGLGLNDSHVLAIVDGLSTCGTHLRELNLESNPGITAQGYGALLNLINWADVVGQVNVRKGLWLGFIVDDKAWEGKLNLVAEMNSMYRRLEYLTNGTFTSEEYRLQWLERVANLPNAHERFPRHSRDAKKEWDAKHLNFIWYTLRQNPEMMQVFQA
jgi:hypothetical protein